MIFDKILSVSTPSGVSKENLENVRLLGQAIDSLSAKLDSLINRPIDENSKVASLLQDQKKVYQELLEVIKSIDVKNPTQDDLEELKSASYQEAKLNRVINRIVDSSPTPDIADLRKQGHLSKQLDNYVNPIEDLIKRLLSTASNAVKPAVSYAGDNLAAMTGPLGMIAKELIKDNVFGSVFSMFRGISNSLFGNVKASEGENYKVRDDVKKEIDSLGKDVDELKMSSTTNDPKIVENISHLVKNISDKIEAAIATVAHGGVSKERVVLGDESDTLDDLAKAKAVVDEAREEARRKGMASVLDPEGNFYNPGSKLNLSEKKSKENVESNNDNSDRASTREILNRIDSRLATIVKLLGGDEESEDSGGSSSNSLLSDLGSGLLGAAAKGISKIFRKSGGVLSKGSKATKTAGKAGTKAVKKSVTKTVTKAAGRTAASELTRRMVAKSLKKRILTAIASKVALGATGAWTMGIGTAISAGWLAYDLYSMNKELEENGLTWEDVIGDTTESVYDWVKGLINGEDPDLDEDDIQEARESFDEDSLSQLDADVESHLEQSDTTRVNNESVLLYEGKVPQGYQTAGINPIPLIRGIADGAAKVWNKLPQSAKGPITSAVYDAIHADTNLNIDLSKVNPELKPQGDFGAPMSSGGNTVDYASIAALIAQGESGGNYETVNSLGFVGKYQMGWQALVDSGYLDKDSAMQLKERGYGNKGIIENAKWTGKNDIHSLGDFLGTNDPEFQKGNVSFRGLKSQIAQEDAARLFYQSNLDQFNRLNVSVGGNKMKLSEAAKLIGMTPEMFLSTTGFGIGHSQDYVEALANVKQGYNVDYYNKVLQSSKDAYGTEFTKYLDQMVGTDYQEAVLSGGDIKMNQIQGDSSNSGQEIASNKSATVPQPGLDMTNPKMIEELNRLRKNDQASKLDPAGVYMILSSPDFMTEDLSNYPVLSEYREAMKRGETPMFGSLQMPGKETPNMSQAPAQIPGNGESNNRTPSVGDMKPKVKEGALEAAIHSVFSVNRGTGSIEQIEAARTESALAESEKYAKIRAGKGWGLSGKKTISELEYVNNLRYAEPEVKDMNELQKLKVRWDNWKNRMPIAKDIELTKEELNFEPKLEPVPIDNTRGATYVAPQLGKLKETQITSKSNSAITLPSDSNSNPAQNVSNSNVIVQNYLGPNVRETILGE